MFIYYLAIYNLLFIAKRNKLRKFFPNTHHLFFLTSFDCCEKLFFVCREGGVFPTKLNKEMFYADFLHYKFHGQSISGLQYQAIQYGPVPVHYDTIYDNIDGISKEIVISHNMESTRLSCEGFDSSVFSEQELQTLNAVLAMAQPMNTKELIDKSHEEEAWLNHHESNGLIPYSEAFALH